MRCKFAKGDEQAPLFIPSPLEERIHGFVFEKKHTGYIYSNYILFGIYNTAMIGQIDPRKIAHYPMLGFPLLKNVIPHAVILDFPIYFGKIQPHYMFPIAGLNSSLFHWRSAELLPDIKFAARIIIVDHPKLALQKIEAMMPYIMNDDLHLDFIENGKNSTKTQIAKSLKLR